MVTPSATYVYGGSVRLQFPYDKFLVEQIKVHIPAQSRSYDPGTKTWTVDACFGPVAIGLLRQTFGDVEIIHAHGQRPPEPVLIRNSDSVFRTLHLLPSAPPALVEAAYKVLARLLHPDLGGNTATMQQVNTAYETIRDRVAS